MRDRLGYWLELVAWAAAWGLTLLSLELIAHENVRHSGNVQSILIAALGLLILVISPMIYREWLGVRAALRGWRGLCRRCGYCLAGLEPAWAKAGGSRCPECGSTACSGTHPGPA